jgi:cyclopropane fatty-acyl-phospholipid synthase-like methyltransferase
MDKLHEEIHRKDFELYCKRNGFCIERGMITGHYASLRTNDFWEIWLHSRANLAVELPFNDIQSDETDEIWDKVVESCAKALRSIGLSIKGE